MSAPANFTFDGTPTDEMILFMAETGCHYGLYVEDNKVRGLKIKTKAGTELLVRVGETLAYGSDWYKEEGL